MSGSDDEAYIMLRAIKMLKLLQCW